jgi:hypothetical protein
MLQRPKKSLFVVEGYDGLVAVFTEEVSAKSCADEWHAHGFRDVGVFEVELNCKPKLPEMEVPC